MNCHFFSNHNFLLQSAHRFGDSRRDSIRHLHVEEKRMIVMSESPTPLASGVVLWNSNLGKVESVDVDSLPYFPPCLTFSCHCDLENHRPSRRALPCASLRPARLLPTPMPLKMANQRSQDQFSLERKTCRKFSVFRDFISLGKQLFYLFFICNKYWSSK